jgi:hypothetical protein
MFLARNSQAIVHAIAMKCSILLRYFINDNQEYKQSINLDSYLVFISHEWCSHKLKVKWAKIILNFERNNLMFFKIIKNK